MSTLQTIKWIIRHGTPSALLALFLLICIGAHFFAASTIMMLNGIDRGTWDPRLLRNVTGIQFLHTNWWFALPYLVLFFGALIYIEVRDMPGWSVCTTFLIMILPLFLYLFTCLRVGLGPIIIMGAMQGL